MTLALVSAKDAAYWAGCSVGTIWRWASEGRITSHDGLYDLREIPQGRRDEWTRELVERGATPPMREAAQAA